MPYAPLPEEIQLDEPLRLYVEADLHPDGAFGEEWLVITREHLRVFARNGGGIRERYARPLAEIKEPKVENLVGGGALEVSRDGAKEEVIRFTTARLPEFASAAGLLGKWLAGEEAEAPEQESKRCPRCGIPLEGGSKVCPACLPKGQTLKRLVAYLQPHKLQAVTLSLLVCSGTAVALVGPRLQGMIVDQVFDAKKTTLDAPERMHLLGVLVLLMLGLHVLRTGLGIASGWMSSLLGNHITHDIRCKLFEHLQYLSLRFFDKRQMGNVISRVNQDTGALQHFLVWGASDMVNNLLIAVGVGIWLFVLNWQLALIVLLPAPIIAIFGGTFWRRIRYYMHRFFRRWGRLNAVLTESLNGLRVVRAFAQERSLISRFNTQSHEVAMTGVHAERTALVLFSSVGMVITLATLVIWYFAGPAVIHGRMSLGAFWAFTAYVGMFFGPVQSLSMLFNWSSRSLTAAERVFEVLDSQPEVIEADQPVVLPRVDGLVEFKNVSFGYERHRPALKNVSFSVAPGEMIGLVGHSGAGKSTTINLLCRFYDVNEGQVLIDGVPINKLSVEDLRKQIGLVPQDTFLFSGTIAENIAYAKPGASREEIIRAAMVANAHDFIRQKPDGYETLIAEGGRGLSGGEMQRIAIARAVLHNPRILILDEATSHVDVETEQQIQQAIGRLVKGRTTFAIAHRLSTLKNADRLLVLKGGEIAEIGTHDELLAKEDGEFNRLVKTYQEISKVRAVER